MTDTMHIWVGYWKTVAVCEGCQGYGRQVRDFPIVDYDHGGYIGTRLADCPDCEGKGYRALTEEEELACG